MEILEGHFVVLRERYRSRLRAIQVVKVTASIGYYYDETWGDRKCRFKLSEALYAGDKDTADKLAAQLTSSAALLDQEHRAAYERKSKRDSEYIAAAKAVPIPKVSDR